MSKAVKVILVVLAAATSVSVGAYLSHNKSKSNVLTQSECEIHLTPWLLAAEDGDKEAQYFLGNCYFYGEYVCLGKNRERALFWYRKAAEQGYAEAQNKLAQCYIYDESTEEQAIYWYRKAAEQGYAESQGTMGYLYLYGWGGKNKDPEQAVFGLRKAAEQGESISHCLLGEWAVSRIQETAL